MIQVALLAIGLSLVGVSASQCGSKSCTTAEHQCPISNPVLDRFPTLKKDLAWTEVVPWQCVYSVSDYSGKSLDDKIKAAAADAYSNTNTTSGRYGVIYVPAGTYKLADDLAVPPGLVLRGDPDTRPAISPHSRSVGTLAPSTKLAFPDREYKRIGCESPGFVPAHVRAAAQRGDSDARWPPMKQAHGIQGSTPLAAGSCYNTGVVNLDIDGAGISLSGSGANSSYLIVLGNRVRNVAYKYPSGPPQQSTREYPGSSLSSIESENEWPWRFATAISVGQGQNALVGNNLVGEATAKASTKVTFEAKGSCKEFKGTLEFPYDNRYGVSLGMAPGDASPVRNASLLENFVYMNGRVGVFFGGPDGQDDLGAGAVAWANRGGPAQGTGMVVRGNHVQVRANSTCYSVDGVKCAGGSDTNENRGYDQTGAGSLVDSNTGEIHRQLTTSGYSTTDGEGVLQQPQDGNTGARNVWTNNDLSFGSSGYMAYYGLQKVEYNTIEKNTVLKSENIGIIKSLPGLKTEGNVCKDNNVKCIGM